MNAVTLLKNHRGTVEALFKRHSCSVVRRRDRRQFPGRIGYISKLEASKGVESASSFVCSRTANVRVVVRPA
jgi:hypothetical protein